MSDLPEADRLADTPHPRETSLLVGHRAAEAALLEAYRGGHIHHAWILGGPEGIGKATLAYRMARFVLANPDPAKIADATDLSVATTAPVARQVASQSHVDLTVLRRGLNEKGNALKGNIAVDDVRDTVRFFATTAGVGGWRVAIVDSADDLAKAGANALLKVLEEPPSRCLFLIVSHQPGRLLPTIRSRCRRIALEALSEAETIAAALGARPDIASDALAESAAIAEGSPRRAIALADGEGVELHRQLMTALRNLPSLDVTAAHALAERCSNKAGEENFALLLAFLESFVSGRIRNEKHGRADKVVRWAELWEKTTRAARDTEVYNLDRKPFVLSTLSALATATKRDV